MANYRSYSPVIGYSGHIPGEKWRVGSRSRERHSARRDHEDHAESVASPTGDELHFGHDTVANKAAAMVEADVTPVTIQASIDTDGGHVPYGWSNNAPTRQSRSSIHSANHHAAYDYGNDGADEYFRRPAAAGAGAAVDALDAELRNFELTERRVRRALADERADLQRRHERRHYYGGGDETPPPHTVLVDNEMQTDDTPRPMEATVANGYGSGRHYDRSIRARPLGGEFGVASPVTLSDVSESRPDTVDYDLKPSRAVQPQPKPRHKSLSGVGQYHVHCCCNAPAAKSSESAADPEAAPAEDAAWTEGQALHNLRAYRESVARRDGPSPSHSDSFE